MSASTRTVQQQTLGNNQLGVALAVVALAIIVAAAIAFGSLNATKAAPADPGYDFGAVGYDHGSSQAATGTTFDFGAVGYDHGSSMVGTYAGPSSTDIRGGTSTGGWSGKRLTAGSGGPRLIPE